EYLHLLDLEVLNNTVLQWGLALLAFLATFTVLPLLKSYVTVRRRKRLEAGHALPAVLDAIVEVIHRTSRIVLWIAALYIGTRFLDLDPRAEKVLSFLVIVVSWLQVGIWLVAAIRFALERRRQRDGTPDAVASGSMTIIMF